MPSEITDFLSSITLPGDLAVPAEVYELIAQAARYWFLLLMAIIVWRSFRWYRRDRRQAKKRLKLLPDAGFVGEMVVIEGGEALKRGQALPLPREGTLGTLRTNDLCVPVEGVARRHLWFRFDEDEGLSCGCGCLRASRGRATLRAGTAKPPGQMNRPSRPNRHRPPPWRSGRPCSSGWRSSST